MHRKTAKEILADSFRELAQEKPIDKITVKDIADNCRYSQATFYRQFKDKYDLIAWDHAQHVGKIMARIGTEKYDWRQTVMDAALSFQAMKRYLANLFRHTSGHDSFARHMTEIHYNALKQYILKNSEEKSMDEMTDMYVRVYVLGTVSLTCEWILGKCKATPEELALVYEKSLPLPLHAYLM